MSSTESLSPVTDGSRPDWPACVQARTAWLRRLQWQPGARRTTGRGRHGGLRLATLQWLDALARRPELHANVVRRSMGIWSSCAMDWRALAQQQADRGVNRVSRASGAGAMGPAGQTVVQWHISEKIVVQPGVMRYAATPALHVASPGAAVSMAPTAKVVAASPAMAYVDDAVRQATSRLSPAAFVVDPSRTQSTGHDVTAAASARSGSFDNASPMTYAAHPVHQDTAGPTVPAATPAPGDVLYDQAMRALSSVPHNKVHNAAATVAPPPLHFDLPRTHQAESSAAASATPGSRIDAAEPTAPPKQLRTRQEAYEVTATMPAPSGNAAAIFHFNSPSGRDATEPPSSPAPSGQVRAPQSSLDFFALMQRKNAMRASQDRSHPDRSAMSWPDRGGPAQRVAASVLPGPSSETGVARIGGASPAPGDMLYDQAMRALSPVPPDQVSAVVATTAPPPLRFDLPRARQTDSMTAAPVASGSHAPAADQRDGPAPTPQSSAAATTNTTDAPLRRGDIEFVAQRVMRIIAREQRREREAKGIN